MQGSNRWKSALTGMVAAFTLSAGTTGVQAADLVNVKRMSMELAQDIAEGAVKACRKKGYQVSAVVLDRGGDMQAMLRDVYAPRMTIDIARQKAGAVILSGASSAQLDRNRSDIASDLNHLEEVLTMAGGLPIESQGSLVGAVAVSGAPGGDIDAECAQASLDKVADRLQFGGL
ncbi:GlcG/HbpS family heme-binding protein [Thiohalorhabdus sp. Cl-TMA]|uniref:Heme-binding protein n=1 Tax=Thiohalorhabdus methylotrophus TaxID=3242694 RepID=A0ABV4TUQ1_9GAMM